MFVDGKCFVLREQHYHDDYDKFSGLVCRQTTHRDRKWMVYDLQPALHPGMYDLSPCMGSENEF